MADPIAPVALALDGLIGWPAALYRHWGHPVGGFARFLGLCDHRWNRPAYSDRTRKLLGIVTIALLLILVIGACILLQMVSAWLLGESAWIAIALLAFPALAQKSLFDHVRPVAEHLATGDLSAARNAVSMIVGRDTANLDAAGISRAAIESLSESFCDGVVAPLFWLLLLGLPGIWAYKALNTADSMIGHKEAPYRNFGWAGARADDIANFIPARLSALAIAFAGGGGWRMMWRDSARHASPNAGWPEAAMAGALGVRLAGPIAYEGITAPKPWIGEEGRDAGPPDIRRALGIYKRACLLLWIIAWGLAWAL